MAEVQRSKLNELYRGYGHDSAVRSLLLRFMREKVKDESSAKFYREYLPNMQHYMPSGGLIIIDFRMAREFLGVEKEQEQAILDLFHDYSEAVHEHQLSLAGAIGDSSSEVIRFHMGMAMKLDTEYGERFRKLLRDEQVKKVPQLLAQVHGYKYSFTPPIKQQLEITPEQANGVIKFMNHQQTKFPDAVKNAGFDYEK